VSARRGAAAAAKLQSIDATAWIAPTAQIFGRVSIGVGSSLWHNAVLRAECQEIRIGRVVNVQDFAMIHVGYEHPTRVGDFCSVAHHATIHGCTLEDAVLVGIGAVVMDAAVIGAGSIVASGAVVTEGKVFPSGSIVAGVPAKQIGERDSARQNRMNAWLYHRNAQAYRRGEHRAWDGPDFEAWRRAKQAEIDADQDLAALAALGQAP
jgi:carbonic anhydrase/acetyltransferase-like protein (isoleucine patch superfamily)